VFSIGVASASTLVGVAFGVNGTTDPANWTLMNTVGTVNNLIDTNGAPTAISISVSATPSVPLSAPGLVPLASTVPSDAPTLTNLRSNFFYNGGTLTAQFSGLTPNATYSVYAIGLRFVGAIDESVTITGGGAPVMFTQSGATSDALFFNGSMGSSSQTLESYAVPIQASNSGTITILFTSGPVRYTVAGVALSSTPSFAVVPLPGSLVLVLIGLACAGLLCAVRRRSATAHGH
jgi:hypothetical protein